MKTIRRLVLVLALTIGAGACSSGSILGPHSPDAGSHSPDAGSHSPDAGS
jgi:hypothetical protein